MSIRGPGRAPAGGRKPSPFSPKSIAKKISGAVDKVKDSVKNVAKQVQAELQKDTFDKGPLAPHIKKILEGFPGLKQAPKIGEDLKPGKPGHESAIQGAGGAQPLPYRPGETPPAQGEPLPWDPTQGSQGVTVPIGTIKRPGIPSPIKGIRTYDA